MASIYEFGPFRLDMAESSLTRNGVVVALTPKALATLTFLVTNAGRLLDKETLLAAIWPDTFVEEATLAQNISALRKALGATDGQRYIETLPKRGYRFIAPVATVEDRPLAFAPVPRPPVRHWRRLLVGGLVVMLAVITTMAAIRAQKPLARPIGHTQSLAVLPFKPLSHDPNGESLGLAMSDALITRLGNMRQIVVRPTTAVRKYATGNHDPIQAGRDLEVDAVLDGTMQWSGQRVRVSVQLFDVRTRAAIWADTFDVSFTDIFAVQDRLSSQVAEAAVAKLANQTQQRTSRHTDDREAYEAYVKGRYFWNKRTEDGYRRAIEHFNVALTRDPNFALAMSGLADAYALLGSMPTEFITRHEAMNRARTLAQRAIGIDNDLAEAHTSLAFVKMHYDWDWKGAESEFLLALTLNPGYPTAQHWYAYYLLSQGRTEEAVESIRRAETLDPLSLIICTDVAEVLAYARRFDEACQQIEKTLQMDPHFPLAYRVAASCGRSVEHLERSAKLGRKDSLWEMPRVYASAGRMRKANELFDRLKAQSVNDEQLNVLVALTALTIGRNDEAFTYLEKALAHRSGSLILTKVEFAFDGVRSDPRYHELLRKMGLPPDRVQGQFAATTRRAPAWSR